MNKGFGMIEVLVAIGLWSILVGSATIMTLGGLRTNRSADESATATHYAAEGIDAVNSIKRQGWMAPFLGTNCTTGCGLATVSGTWGFSGTNNVFDKYTRQVFVTTVSRDGGGNIVSSGGTADGDTYKVESKVTYSRGIPPVTNTISLVDYLTNYTKINSVKKGLLVYADGGTTTDAMKYNVLDDLGNWSTASATADIDTNTTNKVAQVLRVFDSPTRDEKILVSRHFDGSSQYIYSQVFNGTSWGSVQLLASFAAATYLEVRNFDGAYLNDGTFMVVYSDNTDVPKYQTWNGTVWSGQSLLTALGTGQTPTYVRLSARPGTNEAMAVFFTIARDTISEYWSGSVWSTVTSHATNAWNASNQEADFVWSTNSPTTGAAIYMTAGGDKTPRVKLFQANGSGGGTWGSQTNGGNIAQAVRMMSIAERPGANEFQSCYKDQQAAPDITCRKITFAGTTATWSTPTNPIIESTSVNSIGMSFSSAFTNALNTQAIIVYSNNTSSPKYKKYNATTNTWDSAASSIATTPYSLASPIQTVEVYPQPGTSDQMVLMADNNFDLFSVVWDGGNSTMYSSPAGKAFYQHTQNGSALVNYWYDFVWDI